jgi:hypothetical protein
MQRRIIALAIAGLLSCFPLSLPKVDMSRKHERPKGKGKSKRDKDWDNNIRSINQRQRGLRNPIGRGK